MPLRRMAALRTIHTPVSSACQCWQGPYHKLTQAGVQCNSDF